MKAHHNQNLPFALVPALLLLAAPAASRADNLFVSNQGINTSNYIEEFDTTSGVGTIFAPGLNFYPAGLALDSSGSLYVADAGRNGPILKFNTTSGISTAFDNAGQYSPSFLAFDSAGNLYAANGGAIYKYNPSGTLNKILYTPGVNNPLGLAFDSAGNLYVANGHYGNNSIYKFNSSGVGTVFASGLSDPGALVLDSAGNLYVGNYDFNGNGTIEKFSSSGTDLGAFASGSFGIGGLAFDSAGNLYATAYDANGVVGSSGSILEFDPSGAETVFASGLSDAVGLAIQATPEPSTWVLLASGLMVAFWRGGFFQTRNARP